MRRVSFALLVAAVCGSTVPGAMGHDGPDHHHGPPPKQAHGIVLEGRSQPIVAVLEPKDGEKPLAVTWKHRPDLGVLDAKNPKHKEVLDNIKSLHGVFMADSSTGDIYTVFPNVGLAVLGADLKEWKVIGGDKKLAAMNSHGGCVFQREKTTYLAWASTNTREVVVCDTNGQIVSTLVKPTAGTVFKDSHLEDYYGGKLKDLYPAKKDGSPGEPDFNPTSVCYVPREDILCVTTGYTAGKGGDFVLTAGWLDHSLTWFSGGFGRRGNKEGELSTGHGISWVRDSNPSKVAVASRANYRRYTFDLNGGLDDSLQLEAGAFVCGVEDVSIGGRKLSFYPLLNPLGKDATNAGVVVYEGKQKVTLLVPGAEKGLNIMKHIHGVTVVNSRDGKAAFAIMQSWNPGTAPTVFELSVEVEPAKK